MGARIIRIVLLKTHNSDKMSLMSWLLDLGNLGIFKRKKMSQS